ncbi:MAG: hypothetical protein JSV44_03200, partial [Candidatus Zixiibacteriota bacterium]
NFNDGFSSALDIQPNSSHFGRLSYPAQCLGQTRGGFGSGDDFGPGNGIGLGALTPGGCAGGVCRP